jgi:uncharacterized membrane protein HdeD (DUF308 family)
VPDPREVHRNATRVMSVVMAVLGVLLLVLTIARGGGPFSIGTILGILFIAAGVLRLRAEAR